MKPNKMTVDEQGKKDINEITAALTGATSANLLEINNLGIVDAITQAYDIDNFLDPETRGLFATAYEYRDKKESPVKEAIAAAVQRRDHPYMVSKGASATPVNEQENHR